MKTIVIDPTRGNETVPSNCGSDMLIITLIQILDIYFNEWHIFSNYKEAFITP